MKQSKALSFFLSCFLMLAGLWQTCCSVSKTCREQTDSSVCYIGAQPTPTPTGD